MGITSSCHQRLLSFSRGLARPLQARLWQLRVCWASCLSSTTSIVRTQRRSSLGISTSFIATTTCLTHSRYCTGRVCQNGSAGAHTVSLNRYSVCLYVSVTPIASQKQAQSPAQFSYRVKSFIHDITTPLYVMAVS